MDDENTDARAESLNQSAAEALMGFHLNPVHVIAELLTSTAPIGPEVRILLALSLKGANPFGIAIDIIGHENSARKTESLRAKRRDYEIGKKVEKIVRKFGATKGFLEAESNFAPKRDSSFWRKRYYYAVNCDKWLSSARLTGGLYATLDDAQMRDIWHFAAIAAPNRKPSPPTTEKYTCDRIERLHAIESDPRLNRFAGSEREKFIAEILYMMEFLHPGSP